MVQLLVHLVEDRLWCEAAAVCARQRAATKMLACIRQAPSASRRACACRPDKITSFNERKWLRCTLGTRKNANAPARRRLGHHTRR